MRTAPLFLAALLQVGPLCRAAMRGRAGTSHRAAIFFAWLAGSIILLGKPDAVSGASAAVTGAVKYVGTTPVGSPTNYMFEPVSQIFKYRITVSNPGVDIAKNYFNCFPLPPGLTINTNLGAAGYITGTPTAVGTYAVTLLAGNANYPTPSTLPATIVIYPPNAPPVITNQPANLSVVIGSNATFRVAAGGTPAFAYQWLRNGVAMPGKTSNALLIASVVVGDAGDYQAIVTNLYGRATSSVARLTVREPFLVQFLMSGPSVVGSAFQFQVTGPIQTNYVIWGSDDSASWTPLQTNWVLDGVLNFSEPVTAGRRSRIYRATIGP